MKFHVQHKLGFLSLSFTLLTMISSFSSGARASTVEMPVSTGMWRLGFYPSQFANRYGVDKIPYHMYTHIVQMAVLPDANCGLDETSYNVKSGGPFSVTPSRTQLFQLARAQPEKVKVMIMLFQGQTATNFINCTKPEKIDAFVNLVNNYVRTNGYDGLDLDWENGFTPELEPQYQSLVTKLRSKLSGLLFTVDIGMSLRNMVKPVQTQVDRINLMTYDMDGAAYTGLSHGVVYHHASLFQAQDGMTRQSAEAALEYLRLSGIELRRVNFGTPFYGWVLQGCQPNYVTTSGCGKMATVLNDPIVPTRTRLQIEFREVETLYKNGAHVWDDIHGVPYISFHRSQNTSCTDKRCQSDSFVTYNNAQSIYLAAKFSMRKKVGGFMTFALNHEYMANLSGDDRYPLSRAMYNALHTDSSKNTAIENAARAACVATGDKGRAITFSLGVSETCAQACATLSTTTTAVCVKGWTEFRDHMNEYGKECTDRIPAGLNSIHGKICCCSNSTYPLALQYGTRH